MYILIMLDELLYLLFFLMEGVIENARSRGWKKFLNSQAYTIKQKLWRALSRYDDSGEKKSKDEKKTKFSTENEAIRKILEKRSDLFVKRAIVGDIVCDKDIDARVIKFKCKYWLWITVNNLNSFLDFCAIHGFIPMIDKIYIWWQDVSKIKKLYTFFAFVVNKSSNPLIRNSLFNEIDKLDKSVQWPAREIVYYVRRIIDHNLRTYQYLLWENLQKLNNKWALSENIFAEAAIRVENQIRDKIWIESSYLKLAWYNDDNESKTDMKFIIKKTSTQSYQDIPMQFTTSWPVWVMEKERDIEKYIFQSLNEHKKIWNFIIFAVNGEFSKHISHWDNFEEDNDKKTSSKELDEEILNKEYNDWINNFEERQKNAGNNRFPLFIDSIDSKFIKPAEIMYIALHMLYKKYNFRYTTKKSYLDSFKKLDKIDKTNHSIINEKDTDKEKRINLSDIEIKDFSKNNGSFNVDWCSVEKIKNPRPNFPSLLKHRFLISYQGEHMWTIVIYELEENHPQKQKKK